MSRVTIYYILLYIATYTQGVWCNGDQQNEHRIYGGFYSDIEDLPYMAFLEMLSVKSVTNCGGTIISENDIVTSAGCLIGAQAVRARVGSTFRSSGGRVFLADSFSYHPAYDNDTKDFDVGIVHFDNGLELDGENSSKIGVITMSNDPAEGEVMTISGWGKTDITSQPSEILKEARVEVVSRQECGARVRGLTARMFCAGQGRRAGASVCEGDFGGPAVGEANLLSGVASFAVPCGFTGYPGVYTRLGEPMIRSYIRVRTGV